MLEAISFVLLLLDWVIVEIPLSLCGFAVVEEAEGVPKDDARVCSLCVTFVDP